MTVREWFKFGKSVRSDVKQFVVLLVLLSILDNLLTCSGESERAGPQWVGSLVGPPDEVETCQPVADFSQSRKLFGGYRITPTHCKASRAAKYNRGKTICMFNHECVQRGGEVVGACMDGFLFGACCQLKSDSQSHIPKGPGVVMTSYLDYPDPESDTADYESDNLGAWHNSFKPIVTPGYRPGVSSTLGPDENTESVISDGLNQITNTLLNSPEKENNYVYIKPERPGSVYTHSTIDHNLADTILLHNNGSLADNVARPSDFNIQISSMQTKPTVSPSSTPTTPAPKTVSTHRPLYTKPVFKPRPKPSSSTENYVMVSTVTKESQKVTELSSIDSIIQMLNNTPSLKDEVTSPSSDILEHKSSLGPTVSSTSYGDPGYGINYINYYVSPGHYVTVKPSTSLYSTTFAYNNQKPYTTPKPLIKTPIKPVSQTIKPGSASVQTSTYAYHNNNKPSTSNHIPDVGKTTVRPQYSSPASISQSTQEAIDAFNRYPTDPSNFGPSLTTFTYVSSSTTPEPPPSSTRSPNPPYTSYVTGSTPGRKPITSTPNYSDVFASVTPTVVILNNFHTPNPEVDESEEDEDKFVEISQESFQKPVSQITVNNHIETSNNIYMSKPASKPPQKFERPSSPTVVITPKPPPNTTPYAVKSTTKPSSASTVSSFDSFTEYTPTTFKPEMQTSPDDLINFPPVRNPMLNVTGSNSIFNTSITMSNDLEVLHDVEFTTPSWQEDEKLNEKMNLFVNKIVGSLQGTFQELHDIVILDKKPNATNINTRTTTPKPSKKTPSTTKKPIFTTTKKPSRLTTTTKKPVKTTKKPTRLTTVYRRPTTTAPPTTTTAKKPVTTTKKQRPTKTTTVATTTVTELNDDVTTEGFVDNTVDYNDKNLCGVRPLVKSGRIVGGKNAEFGEYPWQVLVRESTWLGLFTKNKCGGVLITNRFVTTAAHCQPGFLASLVAVFGENDISGDKEPRKPVSRNVRRVIVHRQYDAATFENDLALLELESPIKFDAHIVPICMPPDDSDFTGRMATVTGWGRLKYGGGVPAVLQEVQVPVIENSACQEMFLTAGHQKNIRKSFICAGYANGQKDSCEGDSGGPLVLQREDGRWQLVGTVSHGIRCAAPFLPGVYMRTTFYKPWLKSVTGVRG